MVELSKLDALIVANVLEWAAKDNWKAAEVADDKPEGSKWAADLRASSMTFDRIAAELREAIDLR